MEEYLLYSIPTPTCQTKILRPCEIRGRPLPEEGPIVCVCFQVGARRIEAAAAGNGSVETIGRQLGAGTNCGSCIPEIRRLIAAGVPSPRAIGARGGVGDAREEG